MPTPADRTGHLLTPDGVRELRFAAVRGEDGTVRLTSTEPFSMAEGDVLSLGGVALTLGDYLAFRTRGGLEE
ncbi:hypothetical protein LWC35_22830 [Pseudonocardia kujensis]|uniref:hypothetical protein n=1 Tax=Pseudonocardia kujensis TaxID=1128675 RepID=UPI001E58D1A9|nr:hypothetical protein [Pseudonocardia kujensis]MCE0765718.1 hypothetical protein [Pseudonocardia kujensis]